MRLAAALLTLALLESPPAQIVRIDLVAADARGRSVETLKPADFDLRDDGVSQTLESVRFVRTSADAPRLIAVFLDEYHVSPDAAPRVRAALEQLVAEQLAPHDLLVVMKPLDSVFAIRMTADREAALAAIRSFDGRRGDYEARNAYERNFMAGVPARIEAARTQVALSALNALAVHFSSYPDQRKTLIVVSEGIGRAERRRGLEYLPTIETVMRSAQQANVAIYAVNPGQALPVAEDRLAQLAADTAGRAIVLDGDGAGSALHRALDDAGGYYLLTYRASRPEDGRFHAVQVQVKRAGTELRVRSGYYAPSPDEALRRAVLARAAEPKRVVPVEPAAHASTLIRPWFGVSRGENGKTRVTFVWEPASRVTGERVRRVPTRIRVTALAPDDSVVFEGVVEPTGPAVFDEPGGPTSRAIFELPPGRLRTRMAILDAAQAVMDTDVRSISIRNMDSGVTIGTPEVLRARNAREFRSLESAAAVPVSSREFSRTERLLIRFTAHGPGGSPVVVSARLLSRMGPMRELTVTESPEIAGLRSIDVPLAGLAAGEYLIEVHAVGPAGEAKDVVDFRVTT
jgi:VWFA-related protein